MTLFDRLVARSLPLVPKPLVRFIADRYIAGETLAEAITTVRKLNAEGALATVDVLGEDTTERAQAAAMVAEYESVCEAIDREHLECNASIKLTAFGLKIDREFCRGNVERLLATARALQQFVRIDMEDSSCTSDTLALYRELRARFDNVGPVIQAYLRRSLADVRELIADVGAANLNVRLCKGIYNEPPALAFKDKEEIRASYRELLDELLTNGVYTGIATHDDVLVDHALERVAALRLDRSRYEFQMLLGVTPELRRRVIAAGHRLRVYVPFGRSWYGYSVRRLKENPQMAGHVLRSVFRRR